MIALGFRVDRVLGTDSWLIERDKVERRIEKNRKGGKKSAETRGADLTKSPTNEQPTAQPKSKGGSNQVGTNPATKDEPNGNTPSPSGDLLLPTGDLPLNITEDIRAHPFLGKLLDVGEVVARLRRPQPQQLRP